MIWTPDYLFLQGVYVFLNKRDSSTYMVCLSCTLYCKKYYVGRTIFCYAPLSNPTAHLLLLFLQVSEVYAEQKSCIMYPPHLPLFIQAPQVSLIEPRIKFLRIKTMFHFISLKLCLNLIQFDVCSMVHSTFEGQSCYHILKGNGSILVQHKMAITLN